MHRFPDLYCFLSTKLSEKESRRPIQLSGVTSPWFQWRNEASSLGKSWVVRPLYLRIPLEIWCFFCPFLLTKTSTFSRETQFCLVPPKCFLIPNKHTTPPVYEPDLGDVVYPCMYIVLCVSTAFHSIGFHSFPFYSNPIQSSFHVPSGQQSNGLHHLKMCMSYWKRWGFHCHPF